MSFWPFGPHLGNSSQLENILDEYITLLHKLELEGDDLGGNDDDANVDERIGDEKESVSFYQSESIEDEDRIYVDNDFTKYNSLRIEDLMKEQASAKGFLPRLTAQESTRSSLSSLLQFHGEANRLDHTFESCNSEITKQSLNSDFIDRIVNDEDFLNELGKQNKLLIDILCFGYFYDEDSGCKIYHIDYLLNRMFYYMDHLEESSAVAYTTDITIGECSSHDSSDSSDDSGQINYLARVTILSEILVCDSWLISESLVKDHSRMSALWFIINHPNFQNEKSPQLAIFLKIHEKLLVSRPIDYLNFIRQLSTFIDDVLQHVDIPIMLDFLLNVISTDKSDCPTGMIDLVSEQMLIQKCIGYFNNIYHTPSVHVCVGDFLKSVVEISANVPFDDITIGPNKLIRELTSPDIVDEYIHIILSQKGSAACNIIPIIIELIRKNNSDYDSIDLTTTTLRENPPSDRDPIYLGYLLKGFSSVVSDMMTIITTENNPEIEPLVNQMGDSYFPFGMLRIKVLELIAELLHCSNMVLLNLYQPEVISKVRDENRNYLIPNLRNAIGSKIDSFGSEEEPEYIEKNDNEHTSNKEEDKQASYGVQYVNDLQNKKLRKSPTIGDMFKISLFDSQVIPKLLLCFLNNPWNNFIHNVVFDIIQQLFNGKMDNTYNPFIVFSTFNLKKSNRFLGTNSQQPIPDFSIIEDFVMKGFTKSYELFKLKHQNYGYMGHLILISEEISKFSELFDISLISREIDIILKENSWVQFSENILLNIRAMHTKILGGGNLVEDNNGNLIPDLLLIGHMNSLSIDDESSYLSEQFTEDDLHHKVGEIINIYKGIDKH